MGGGSDGEGIWDISGCVELEVSEIQKYQIWWTSQSIDGPSNLWQMRDKFMATTALRLKNKPKGTGPDCFHMYWIWR